MNRGWVKRAAGGDEKAFGQIVDRYKGYLMATILPIVRDPDEAQDVLQEIFWQAYRSLPHFRGGNLKFWLARIAVNKAIDWRRKQKKHSRELLHRSPGDLCSRHSLSAEEEYLNGGAGDRLARSLQSLPPPYRATVAGYLLEGKNYRQLADEAGISIRTVESRLYRARKILRNEYKEGL